MVVGFLGQQGGGVVLGVANVEDDVEGFADGCVVVGELRFSCGQGWI